MARTLSDPDLEKLARRTDRRVNDLLSQGVQIFGISEHYVESMLEELLGNIGLAKAREKHLLWLDDKLDEAEQQIRQAKITAGIAGFNGHSR